MNSALARACSKPRRYLRLRSDFEAAKLILIYMEEISVKPPSEVSLSWDIDSMDMSYILIFHGRYGCIVDREHQRLIRWCEGCHVIIIQITEHLLDRWHMDNLYEEIHIS